MLCFKFFFKEDKRTMGASGTVPLNPHLKVIFFFLLHIITKMEGNFRFTCEQTIGDLGNYKISVAS